MEIRSSKANQSSGMAGQVNVTMQNWEKISDEHQKLYKIFNKSQQMQY
jgi:hypothetical protein